MAASSIPAPDHYHLEHRANYIVIRNFKINPILKILYCKLFTCKFSRSMARSLLIQQRNNAAASKIVLLLKDFKQGKLL